LLGKYWIILCFLFVVKLETLLIGVFRELTLIPSFLGGVLLPLLLVNNFSKKK